MGDLLKLIFINKFSLFFLISVLPIYYFIQQSLELETHFLISDWLIESNYIVLIPTMMFIVWSYYRVKICMIIKNNSMIRIGEKIYSYYVNLSVLSIVYMLVVMYMIPSLIYVSYFSVTKTILFFFLLKLVAFFISETIYLYILAKDVKNTSIYISIPVIMQFMVHYYIILA